MKPELDPFMPVMKDAQTAMEGAQHTLRVINSITGTYYPSNDVSLNRDYKMSVNYTLV